jgi:enterochelin esterase-like enzyme
MFGAVTMAGALWLVPTLPASAVEQGRVVMETVHGVGLEKTVTGESAERSVAVYVPPGYDKSSKRYPVIYLLHGIGGTDVEWVSEKEDWASIQSLMDHGIAAGFLKEMIVVMPNEQTNRFGSFYTNSIATGKWEDFTVQELVAYIDHKYRTIAKSASRGLAGHSMGGYGALKLGMKHTDVYSVVYGMNPALVGWGGDLTATNPAYIEATKAKTFEQIPPPSYAAGIVTVAQAFSPNLGKPPFYVDLPYAEVNGKVLPAEPAFSEWEANFVANLVPKYRTGLAKLRGYRFDSAYEDEFRFIPVNTRELSLVLTTYGIDHVFEEYNGDHRNRLWGRTGRLYTQLLPYFSLLLDSQ